MLHLPMRTAARDRLLRIIEGELQATTDRTGIPGLSPEVREALCQVPREAFVRPQDAGLAYENRPLPIGEGQTISQPFIVALMTEALRADTHTDAPLAHVLEVGTGCGYQAAVLAELFARVDTVELLPELAASAAERLARLGYENVHVHGADGYGGWPAAAPYDGILVTAAAPAVPPALVEQLRPGAHLIIPLGEPGGYQELVRVTRNADGDPTVRSLLPVAFVPMVPGPREA